MFKYRGVLVFDLFWCAALMTLRDIASPTIMRTLDEHRVSAAALTGRDAVLKWRRLLLCAARH